VLILIFTDGADKTFLMAYGIETNIVKFF